VATATAVAVASIEADADDVANALRFAMKFAHPRSAVEALAGVKIRKHGRELVLETTDLTSAARVYLAGEVEGKPEVLVSIKDLETVLKAAKGRTIRLTPEDGKVAVQAGSRRVKLPQLRHEDWPKLDGRFPTPLEKPTVHAVGADLALQVGSASTFASTDETRPILTGVLVDPTKACMVATDSYFLGHVGLPGRLVKGPAGNVPWKPFLAAVKGLGDDEGVILELHHTGDKDGNGQAVIRRSGAEISIRLTGGVYPKWDQLLPPEGAYQVDMQMPLDRLLEVLTAAQNTLTANEPVVVSVDPAAQQIVIRAESKKSGAVMEDTIDGEVVLLEPDPAAVAKTEPGTTRTEEPPEIRTALEAAKRLVASTEKKNYTSQAAAEKAADAATEKAGNPLITFRAVERAKGRWVVESSWPMRCGFNPRLLADAAEVLDAGETIRWRIISPLRPARFDGANGDWAIVMPIRVGA
jgi:DNA polymerase III sliding clamp (beta) subunit (PCNA family)